MKVKTQDLTGPALDWGVAKATGQDVEVLTASEWYSPPWVVYRSTNLSYRPSTAWSQGGYILDKLLKTGRWEIAPSLNNEVEVTNYNIESIPVDGISWAMPIYRLIGGAVLEPVCKAFVIDRLGATIEIPDELVEVNSYDG